MSLCTTLSQCPLTECIQYLESAPEKVYAKAFDLVLNGTELSSGSIRITDYELQQKMFQALGLTDEEIEAKFGFLVEAISTVRLPHGGSRYWSGRTCNGNAPC